jgi:N-acetylneuraminate synthase
MKLKGVHGTWGKTVSEVFKEVEFPLEWHKEIVRLLQNDWNSFYYRSLFQGSR